jgi:hypothetical protein
MSPDAVRFEIEFSDLASMHAHYALIIIAKPHFNLFD